MNVAFFFVGEDISEASMMVSSLRRCDPEARITHCTDNSTPEVAGVDSTERLAYKSRGEFMVERVTAFSKFAPSEPTAYVDTDMLWLRKINLEESLGNKHALVCNRSFSRNAPFNPTVILNGKNKDESLKRTLQYNEYRGKALGDVFPYLACFTVLREGSDFWSKLLDILSGLDEKYKHWYGDQEALKLLVSEKSISIGLVPESSVACLPEFLTSHRSTALIHFKGNRKADMRMFYEQMIA